MRAGIVSSNLIRVQDPPTLPPGMYDVPPPKQPDYQGRYLEVN